MLIVYIHLDMYLGYVKSEGELPRSTSSSSWSRPVKDLFVSVNAQKRRSISVSPARPRPPPAAADYKVCLAWDAHSSIPSIAF